MIRFTQRVVELLEPALDLGVEVLIGKDGVDLNTMMKSHCILKSVDGNIVAFCRYDQEFLIESYEDILEALDWCEFRKGFGNGIWMRILSKHYNKEY
tara:strand:+ start:66 stop:356 length:291 start_codon:yes stop_codon:yes gene_type:complete